MVKHIVIFRLKDDIEPARKAEIMNQFKSGILALPAVIPTIRQ
ncbi:MAG: Dabb family protein, partial [Prevotellamassilia sp.]|nr:Dabb family protein [Prevotellamassilia sp.]